MSSRSTRGGRRAGRLLLVLAASLAATLVLGEASLRVASLFVDEQPDTGWRPGTRVHVLAIGDSHTYGGTVKPEETYPAQLQRHLDELRPGAYSVINLGIPGVNTAQVRNRLALNLARWEPDVVVIWCGINNAWNASEMATSSVAQRVDALLLRLKVYKLARVLLHDRALNVNAAQLAGQRHKIQTVNRHTQDVPFFGKVETQDTGTLKLDREAVVGAIADYRAMRALAQAAGVEILFISYHLDFERFTLPNQALRELERTDAIALVDGMAGYERVPSDQVRLTWAAHPSAPVYGEIARDVAQRIVALTAPGLPRATSGP